MSNVKEISQKAFFLESVAANPFGSGHKIDDLKQYFRTVSVTHDFIEPAALTKLTKDAFEEGEISGKNGVVSITVDGQKKLDHLLDRLHIQNGIMIN